MLEPRDAALRITGAVSPLAATDVALTAADGLVLAADVTSPISMPLWPNSAMDGYACRAPDVRGATSAAPVRLAVIEEVRAGAFPERVLGEGQATRIATGAPIPDGADTVVRVEDTDGGAHEVRITNARDAGRNVRPAGEDILAGQTVLTSGTVLGGAQIAMLAAVGAANVRVHQRPRVAVLTTGDELVPLERFDEVRAGRRIVSSTSYGLAAAIRSAGGEPVSYGIVPDNAAAVRDAMVSASECDLIVSSAGVSVGDADYLRSAIAALGGAVDFWRVRMRPGSPLAFGSVHGTPWIGLPGNPVSTLVTFDLFARPTIRKLMGHRKLFAARTRVVCGESLRPAPGITHYLRVRLHTDADGVVRARTTGPQASNILSSVALADALLIAPADAVIEAGASVDVIPLGEALTYTETP